MQTGSSLLSDNSQRGTLPLDGYKSTLDGSFMWLTKSPYLPRYGQGSVGLSQYGHGSVGLSQGSVGCHSMEEEDESTKKKMEKGKNPAMWILRFYRFSLRDLF
jgi:hypothetical protein